MSRAFVKEPDGSEPPENLPERQISPHRNFVTAKGLQLIEAEIARLSAEKEVTPQVKRDLNYWQARRANAELIETSNDISEVKFGHSVTMRRENGTSQTYQITGQDQADPAKGLISYVSPLAASLLGKSLGDIVEIGGNEAEIVKISAI